MEEENEKKAEEVGTEEAIKRGIMTMTVINN